jgi:hypothetical protein
MLKLMRNLLVLAALCWVPPATARQGAVAGGQHADKDCPQERSAKAKPVQRQARAVIIKVPDGSASIFGHASAFSP